MRDAFSLTRTDIAEDFEKGLERLARILAKAHALGVAVIGFDEL